MKKGNLPISWVRWRRRRYRVLVAQGLGTVAWDIAKSEAKARHRIARVIGRVRAREAQLVCIGDGSELRFALTGDISGLTDDEVSKFQQISLTVAGSSA